jgi:hypothetical protein
MVYNFLVNITTVAMKQVAITWVEISWNMIAVELFQPNNSCSGTIQ